jgi:hypothetical protein
MTKLDLDYLGLVIADAATTRAYGLYDYSSYPGEAPPHVVRNEITREEVFRSHDAEAALREYQRLSRVHTAKAVLTAMRRPSEEMCEAGARYYHDNWREGHAKDDTSMPLIWEAMIDELLHERVRA